MNPGAKKPPTFLWHGFLIVAPVLVLAAVGAFSTWQDSALARHEAAQRAQAIADDLWPKFRAALLVDQAGRNREFVVGSLGQLLRPAPYPETPAPHPFAMGSLRPDQTRLWRAAQASEGSGSEATARAYDQFLQSGPPDDFAAAAHYAAGFFLLRSGRFDEATAHLRLLVNKFPQAKGESGLPLKPLAEVKLLELPDKMRPDNMPPAVTLEAVCSNLVNDPTTLTPQLLNILEAQANGDAEKAQVGKWQRIWGEQQVCRELYFAAEPQLRTPKAGAEVPLLEFSQVGASSTSFPRLDAAGWNPPLQAVDSAGKPRFFWFRARGVRGDTSAEASNVAAQTVGPPSAFNWLAIEVDVGPGRQRFTCRSEWEVGTMAKNLVQSWKHIPDYFGVGVEVAGQKLTWPAPDLRLWHEVHYLGGKGMGQVAREYSSELATTVLASAGGPTDQVRLGVYLTSPAALYKYQRARTFWFGLLIAAAAVAALVGLVTAYRAFERQLRLSEMKSDFVSSVSHELRAPIASVRLMAESLEQGKITDPVRQREYFHFIDQECRRLSALIENVLDFSRIEQGRKQYDFEPTDLEALTRHTVRLMQTYAAERGVRLELVIADKQTHQVSADGKALQQALVNLIDNAVKHSPANGKVTIGLELDNEPAPANLAPEAGTMAAGPRLRLWVEDQGPGIPPAEHAKIFERFYRRGPELRRETQGVGIGLSIVKHIVEAHGGRVRVRSDVGQGSRFTIELPIGNGEQSLTS